MSNPLLLLTCYFSGSNFKKITFLPRSPAFLLAVPGVEEAVRWALSSAGRVQPVNTRDTGTAHGHRKATPAGMLRKGNFQKACSQALGNQRTVGL